MKAIVREQTGQVTCIAVVDDEYADRVLEVLDEDLRPEVEMCLIDWRFDMPVGWQELSPR